MSIIRKAFLFASLATLAGTVACDNTMDEGDYVVYRVSFEAPEYGTRCFEDAGVAELASIENDTTNIGNAATFIVYAYEGAEPTLDTGSSVLSGNQDSGSEYTFDGKTVDVEVPPGEIILDADHDGLDDLTEDPMVDADVDGIDDDIDEEVDTDNDLLDDRFEDDLVDADLDGEDDRTVELPGTVIYRTVTKVAVDLTVNDELVSGRFKTTITTSCEGEDCPETYGSQCTVTRDFTGVELEDADVAVAPSEPATPTP